MEEVYEQFSNWLEDPIFENDSSKKKDRELDSRDLAVVRFASSLLKRTLSESFAGVPLTDGCAPMDRKTANKHKLMLSVRSLSLELAKHKHKLAAQLVSFDKCINGFYFAIQLKRFVCFIHAAPYIILIYTIVSSYMATYRSNYMQFNSKSIKT